MSDAARERLVLTKTDEEPTSFTSVRSSADLVAIALLGGGRMTPSVACMGWHDRLQRSDPVSWRSSSRWPPESSANTNHTSG
jgi:hypothetical protein